MGMDRKGIVQYRRNVDSIEWRDMQIEDTVRNVQELNKDLEWQKYRIKPE